MRILADIEQGSPEWHAERIGRATASLAAEIVTPKTGEISASARGVIAKLVADSIWPGEDIPEFKSAAMLRGTDLEHEAREAFRAETGLTVREVGIVIADDNICACSPDGLILAPESMGVEYLGGLEIKCPLKDKHARWVMDGVLPAEYRPQVHWSLAVTGFDEWHFWSFHPAYRPFHLIVKRDDYTAKVEKALASFVQQYRDAMTAAKPKLQIPAELAAA